jgi:hypothetical protein
MAVAVGLVAVNLAHVQAGESRRIETTLSV